MNLLDYFVSVAFESLLFSIHTHITVRYTLSNTENYLPLGVLNGK